MRLASRGISRAVTAIAIIVILVVAGAAYFFLQTSSGPTSSSSSTTSSISSTSSTSATSAPYNETVIVDETTGEPSGVDATLTDAPGTEIMFNIAQGLIWYHGNTTTEYAPVLATSWQISPDGLTYTFDLKQGLVFSDGNPFNAYAAWFNYYRLVLNNGYSSFIIGPGQLSPGNITLDDLNTFNFINPTPSEIQVMANPSNSIQAVDANTIAFHIAAPIPSFLARLAAPEALIFDPTFIQQHGGVEGNGTINQYVDSHGAPGTGPYELQQWTHGCCITLTLNPHYAGPQPHVSKVIIQYKADQLTAIDDLKSGAVQMYFSIPFNLISNLAGTSGITLENTGLSYVVGFMGLNIDHYPLNITDVRLAIQYAINRTAIIDSALSGYGETFQGPVPLAMFAHPDIQPLPCNVTMAENLLTEAGFPNGNGIPPLTLLYHSDNPSVSEAVQIIQSELGSIGITVNLQGVTFAEWVNIWATVPRVSNYPDIMWGEWSPDFAYPDDYVWTFENAASEFDTPNTNNTLMNQWTNQAINTANTTLQIQLYSQITQLDKQIADNVWLWQAKDGVGVPAYSSSVHNVYYNPLFQSGFNYSAIWVSP